MASLASQQQNLKLALGEAIKEFARIAEHSSGRIGQELSGLYGKWVKESFEKALAETKSINVDKVLDNVVTRQLKWSEQHFHQIN